METVRALIRKIERELVVVEQIKQLLITILLLQSADSRYDFRVDIKQLRGALALLSYEEQE